MKIIETLGHKCMLRPGHFVLACGILLLAIGMMGCEQPITEEQAPTQESAPDIDTPESLSPESEATHEPPQENAPAESSAQGTEDEGATEEVDAAERPPITPLPPEELGELVQAAQDSETPLVINFWATWCPPCLEEMPHFVEFYETYDREQVEFISITADHIDTLDSAIKPYQAEEDLPFPIYILEGMEPAPYGEVLNYELTGALPVTLVFDADGALAESWNREIGYDELEEAVESLI